MSVPRGFASIAVPTGVPSLNGPNVHMWTS